MAAQYSIGSQEFLELAPPPPRPHKWVTYEASSGTDGHSIYQDGTRGFMHQCTTLRDTLNQATALALVEEYEAMCGFEPVPVVWRNIQWAMVLPHHVSLMWCNPIVSMVGGLTVSPQYLFECQWSLFVLE